jgi:hypothetical protein
MRGQDEKESITILVELIAWNISLIRMTASLQRMRRRPKKTKTFAGSGSEGGARRMNRAHYERMICAQAVHATAPIYKRVSLQAWIPLPSQCHENVDRWVEANPGQLSVRGWVFYMPYAFATGESGQVFTAHSVVKDRDGLLYDITPLGDERIRQSLRFVPHLGTEPEFWVLEKSNRCIYCPEQT